MRNYWCVFIFLFYFFVPLYSAETNAGKMRIAVLDFKADGTSGLTARMATSLIRTEFVKSGKFIIIERNQMDSILKEQGLQQTGCTDTSCAVQLGKLLSARKMLVGEVSSTEKSILITARIIDVENGTVDFAEVGKAPDEEALDSAAAEITKKLIYNIQSSREDTDGPGIKIVYGRSPSGIVADFTSYTPLKSPVKDYYDSLIGGSLGYIYDINEYLSIVGTIQFVYGSDSSDEANIFLNSYQAGARSGLPIFDALYPYIGVYAGGMWVHESGKLETADFFGYRACGSAGIALTFFWPVSIYAEFAYSWSKITDENNTDVSGTVLNGGIIYKF